MVFKVYFLILFTLIEVNSWPSVNNKTQGEIWPLPQKIFSSTKTFSINPNEFEISSVFECDIISDAIQRYSERIFPIETGIDVSNSATDDSNARLESLTIEVRKPCTVGIRPSLDMDESYTLDVTRSKALLQANEVWGALHGLESFSHMIIYAKTDGYRIRANYVKDFPRFPHRGVLLDSSRHFLSINFLKANIDLMAQNKFNVFHWHITDSESSPYNSNVLPRLILGAFSDQHQYTIEEINDLIEYARLRGIRVIPEFDTPGHVNSWGIGYPEIVARCYTDYNSTQESFNRGVLDPTKSETWEFLAELFKEVFYVFPDEYVHIGADEVDYWSNLCWTNNKLIRDFMKSEQLNTTMDLQGWYLNKLRRLTDGIGGKKFMYWQEVLNTDVNLNNSIVQVWKSNQTETLESATRDGHHVILSSCWYLDTISAADIPSFYRCDPQDFHGTDTQKSLVLGGEAALWGEMVDETNLVQRLWPRASAVAERLWSSPLQTQSFEEAWPRLYEMQCRMVMRGYPAQPGNGPGYCSTEYKANLPI